MISFFFGLWSAPAAFGAAAFITDRNAEFKAAQKAEKQGDLAAALLHYENLMDSARTETKITTRAKLATKIAELRPKVKPNTDPAQAGVWKVKAYAFRTTDVRWTDKQGANRHAFFQFSDTEIAGLRNEMANFAGLVWKYTSGSLRIQWDLTVIEKPLTNWHGWPDPGSCLPHFTDLKHGEADSLFVYVKAEGAKGEKSDRLEWALWGGTIGVTAETKGACYIGYNCGPTPEAGGSGELELHEWLHAAEMALRWVQAYGDWDVVDWTSDGGGYAESWGLWQRPPGEKEWLPFYETIMVQWVTRKMWHDCSVTRRSDNPWLNGYVRDFLALGPFAAEGKPDGGLDEVFFEEAAAKPKAGEKLGGRAWQLAGAPGKFVTLTPVFGGVGDGKVYYLAFVARAVRGHRALLHNQRDGGCKIWQNGELIYASRVDREWSSRPNVLDAQLQTGDNLFLIKLTRMSGDWSFNLKVTNLRGEAFSDVSLATP